MAYAVQILTKAGGALTLTVGNTKQMVFDLPVAERHAKEFRDKIAAGKAPFCDYTDAYVVDEFTRERVSKTRRGRRASATDDIGDSDD